MVDFEAMRTLELKIPPPLIGLTTGFLMWCVATYGWREELTLTTLRPFSVALAAVLVAAGVAFDLAGLVAFQRQKTTINPLRPGKTSSIVTTGIYRFSRNPMYAGMLLILAGWAVYLGHLIAVFCLPLFVTLINRLQIQPEERILQARFGGEYDAYVKAVRRWL